MPRGDSYQLQGQQGGVVLEIGSNVSGNFRWVQIIQDTVFDAFEGNLVNITSLEGTTIPAGIGIGGNFTQITVSTGKVIAYYA